MPEIKDILFKLQDENRLRVIPPDRDEYLTDLSLNDYLSLAGRCREFFDTYFQELHDCCFSSSASRLLAGKQQKHLELESLLEGLYRKKALLFNSGYHANVGCIGALTMSGTLFVCDKLIHASIIDGLKAAGSEYKRFPHNDIVRLRRILEEEYSKRERIIIVTEAIFSMDGDEAPLEGLAELKNEYPDIFLYIDEAHSFGVRGDRGLGLCEEKGLIEAADLIVGTFGKAAASCGAFAICTDEVKSLLVNCARPFIFSTALPPVNMAWTAFMVNKILGMKEERRHLSDLSRWFKKNLERITGNEIPSTSQIIPLLTGDAAVAMRIAAALKHAGFTALPIRRPTVPPGGERIRFSLAAGMTEEELQPIFDILANEMHTDTE